MWEERELGNVEFIPEPSDYHILSAVILLQLDIKKDGEARFWGAPTPVPVVSRQKRLRQRLISTGFFLILIMVMWAVWRSQLLFIEIPPPNQSGLSRIWCKNLQSMGYTGDGISVCMVDTGIDPSHSDLNQSI